MVATELLPRFWMKIHKWTTTPRSSSRAHSHPAARAPRLDPAEQQHTSRSETCCGSARPRPRPERQNALRPSTCEHGQRSCGTSPAVRLASEGTHAAARCSFYCRTRHRQLVRQAPHRARRSSCDDDDQTRWTCWRSLRSRRVALLVRTFPLRANCGRGVPRREFYQDALKTDSDGIGCRTGFGLAPAFQTLKTAFVTNLATVYGSHCDPSNPQIAASARGSNPRVNTPNGIRLISSCFSSCRLEA